MAEQPTVPMLSGDPALSQPRDTEVLDTMDIDPMVQPAPPQRSKKQPKRRRKRPARIPPLFERSGHVIFKGNEVLTDH